ncbi:MAG: type IV toxin-antitoxin system AbiEi family antitoxin domain-containing protein [bacterium]|nr:type IV toxin-antitoxin system AbiEi family antitoxin domain-containing protein [bacterium]
MRARTVIPTDLEELATSQGGVILARQANANGVSGAAVRRLLERGELQRVARGIYYIGSAPVPWVSVAAGAVLAGGESAVIGGEAAAYLWELSKEEPGSIEVLVPQSRKTPDTDSWNFTRSRRPVKAHGSPPRTTLADTILDMCERQPEAAARWIDAGLRRPGVSARAILAAMDTRRRFPLRAEVEGMIRDHIEGVHTELERAYRANVERPHGLPEARRQVRRGNRFHDLEYLERLIVELDGRLGHEGFSRFRDMDRDNQNLVLGLLTLRYGWFDCTRQPCAVAMQVFEILVRLGWTGEFQRCPRCP